MESQRILRLLALNPAYVCEISVLFFVFRCTLAWSTVLLFSSLPVFNFSNRNNKSEPMTNRQKVRIILFWWTRRGSNPRPLGCEPNALPAELRAHVVDLITIPQQGKIVKLVLKKVRRCCSAWKSGRRTPGKRVPEVGKGLYHAYPVKNIVPDAKRRYENMLRHLRA